MSKYPSTPDLWEPKISSWEKIQVNTYKFIYDRAVIRFESIASESELITQRTISLFKLMMAFLSGFIGLNISFKNIPVCPIIFISLIYLITIAALLKLLYKRKEIQRGSEPKKLLVSDLEKDPIGSVHQEPLVYYNEICRLQSHINYNAQVLAKRQNEYVMALILSAIAYLLTVCLSAYAISIRP